MKIFKVLFLLFPLLVFSNTSIAQGQCGPRENIVQALEQRAGETLINIGFVNSKRVIEIYVNKETDTWTVVSSTLTPAGKKWSCIIYYGKMWLTFEEPVGDSVGDPASY